MSKQRHKLAMRTCWCGKAFIPKRQTQTHCCPKHSRIYNIATHSKYGRNLIRKDPEAAINWYTRKQT
jgi:hypothetical protein